MNLTVGQMISTAAIFRNTTVAEIARAIGMAPSVLYRKINRNTLKPWELSEIAEALGGEYHFHFSFPNGSKIGALENQNNIRPNKKIRGGPRLPID